MFIYIFFDIYSLHRLNQGAFTEWTTGGEEKMTKSPKLQNLQRDVFKGQKFGKMDVWKGPHFHCFPMVGMVVNLIVRVYIITAL